MGKKPAPKPKAKQKTEAELKAEAEAEAEAKAKAEARRIWQQRKDAGKWTQEQVDAIIAQREAAAGKGEGWLEEPHKWHQEQLGKVAKRLELKLLDDLPAELREGVTAYVAQCAGGAEGKQADFKDPRDLYQGLPALPDESYVRAEQTPEAVKAAEELAAWTDTSVAGMGKFVGIMKANEGSAAVAEAGVTRIGFLVAEASGEAPCPGGRSDILMPGIEQAMNKWIKDPDVQRRGCAALRALAMTKGQLPPMCEAGASTLVFNCLKEQLKVPDVVLAANAAVWEMCKAAEKSSPELAAMRHAGIIDILKKVMTHHAWDQTLVGKVRVVLPFLVED